MKFTSPSTYEKWTKDEFNTKIINVQKDIIDLCREVNDVNSQINILIEKKRVLRGKIGNKNKYFSQLISQYKELPIK